MNLFKNVSWSKLGFEGVLIIVSILVAFSIDSWWADRQDRKSERQYLELLLADARTDIQELTLLRGELQSYLAASQIVTDLTNGKHAQVDMRHLLACSTFLPRPVISRGTFSDLLSTGNLALLRDRAVRGAVLAYYAKLDASRQFLDELRGYQADYRAIVLSHTPVMRNAPRYPDADALLSDLRSDGNLTPALRRMQFAQRRMLSRTWAEAEAAEQYASSLVAALRTLGGDPNTIEAGTAPSSQFDSGCSKFNAEQVTEAYDNTE